MNQEMSWKDIDQCLPDTKGIFGYRDQFDRWQFNCFSSRDQPMEYGYTHWLDIKDHVE